MPRAQQRFGLTFVWTPRSGVLLQAQTGKLTIGQKLSGTGLPAGTKVSQAMRDWGWADDAVAMPGWARPAVDCDPAFKNIRAGMEGVPILYHFKVDSKSKAKVVLGFCESHWGQAGQRPGDKAPRRFLGRLIPDPVMLETGDELASQLTVFAGDEVVHGEGRFCL